MAMTDVLVDPLKSFQKPFDKPFEKAFERYDKNYDQQQQKEQKIREEKRFEKEKEKEKDNENEPKKSNDGLTYAQRKMQNQLNTIKYEADKKARNMKTKKAQVNEVKWMEGNRMITALDDEMSNTMKKKSWKCMDMCFRWTLVHDYLENIKAKGVYVSEEDTREIKKQLQAKTLDVIYDKPLQIIKSLNFKTKENTYI